MTKGSRWVLLEHIVALDDPLDIHFDLLLEDGGECRTWRLDALLVVDGPSIEAIRIGGHKLHWLETSGRIVSGGKGWAYPITSGWFKGLLPVLKDHPVHIELHGGDLTGLLQIDHRLCKLSSIGRFYV